MKDDGQTFDIPSQSSRTPARQRYGRAGIKPRVAGLLLALSWCLLPALPGRAQEQNRAISDYFGFQPLEVLAIDDDCGPMVMADLNADGLNDLAVVNNHKSRIELYYQRKDKPSEAQAAAAAENLRVNELGEDWRFRHERLPVAHHVNALCAGDVDSDGKMDLVYAGTPSELVWLHQTTLGTFEIADRLPVRDLTTSQDGMLLTNLLGGDHALEVVACVDKNIIRYPIGKEGFGQPDIIPVGERLSKIAVGDVTGDQRPDLIGIAPDSATPIRLWVAGGPEGGDALGRETRFAIPALRDFVLVPSGKAGQPDEWAMIERITKRISLNRFMMQNVDRKGTLSREAPLTVQAFPSTVGSNPGIRVCDVDGDGLDDVVVTDSDANDILLYRQVRDQGLVGPEKFPTLAQPAAIAVGRTSAKGNTADLFVMSQADSVVGRSVFKRGAYDYPVPLGIKGDLVTIDLVQLDQPELAVITRDRRQHTLQLVSMDNEDIRSFDLGSLSRSPQFTIAWDADQDGLTDLLVLTPNEPMIMLHQKTGGDFEVLNKDKMAQFGLVQAASADNTALLDIDNDGKPELLIADRNYVRCVRYQPTLTGDLKGGWQVVEQFNLPDASAKLVSLAVNGSRIVVADKNNRALDILERSGDTWKDVQQLQVKGFDLGPIVAGSFDGDHSAGILCLSPSGMALAKLEGNRWAIDEQAAYRTDREERLEFRMAAGDVNGDGLSDIVVLDAGEQMVEVFTISEAGKLLPACEWEAFQSKIFEGGETREYEPRDVVIGDITGDGAQDIAVICHDRVLIYPQMTGTADRHEGPPRQ